MNYYFLNTTKIDFYEQISYVLDGDIKYDIIGCKDFIKNRKYDI